jgi:hypothetical protein
MPDAVGVISLAPGPSLAADTEEWLVDGLTAALPELRLSALFALRRDMFRDAHVVTVATEATDGAAVGVLSSRWCELPSGRPFLHVLTQFVGTRYQHGAVFRQSWREHFAALGTIPELVALKTYNPIVYCALHVFTRIPGVILYPDVSASGGQDPSMTDLAGQVAATVAAGHVFVPGTGVIRDIGVPRDLYREMPRSASSHVNEYFAASATPADRVLCVLSVPGRAEDAIRAAFGIALPFGPPDSPRMNGEGRGHRA